jgi:hypothetical protein
MTPCLQAWDSTPSTLSITANYYRFPQIGKPAFLLNAILNGMKKFDSCTVRSQLGFSRDDVCAHDGEVIAGSLKRLLGVMLRDETPIVVQSEISLPSETVEDRD